MLIYSGNGQSNWWNQMVRIETNKEEVDKSLDILYTIFADSLLDRLAFALERRVKMKITQLKLVDKGRFRTSVKGRRTGVLGFIVSDGVHYGIYHETGTGIYGPRARMIVPINKKALHWEQQNYSKSPSGRVKRITTDMFSMKSKGVKAKRPFLLALEEFETDLDQQIKAASRGMLK
jgi:hypothetical protein